MKKLGALLAFSLALLSGSPLSANIGPPSMTEGSKLSPTAKESQVQMVDEHVKLDLKPNTCKVDAVFHLKNWGKTKLLEVGFPYEYDHDLQNFKAWVNGVQMKISQSKRDSGNTVYRQYWPSTNWKLWKSWIRHGEVQTVKVTYTVTPERNEPQFAGHEDTENKFPQWGKINQEYNMVKAGPFYPEEYRPQFWDDKSMLEITRDITTGYTLRSGQPWKGKIQESIVEADWKLFHDWYPERMTPAGSALTVRPGYSRWTFKNLEPDEDIRIRLKHRIQRPDFVRAYKANAMNHLTDFVYCADVCETLLAFGSLDDAVDLAKKSLEKWSPETVVDMKPSHIDGTVGYIEMAAFLEKAYKKLGDSQQSSVYAELVQKMRKLAVPVNTKASGITSWGSIALIRGCPNN